VAERALLDKLAGRRVVASVSGGKDSAALSLWLKGQSIEHDRVFMDTGWEHPATYEYLRGELTRVIGPITEIRADLQMVDLIRKKKMFPSRLQRFCTTELKVRPMQRFIRSLQDGGVEPVNAVGIRREESASRSAATEWEWTDAFDCEVWRPLVAWTEAQVVAIHAKHDLRPNPLYLQGASRVGCWPCIHARKNEIRLVADVDPTRIDLIGALERELAAGQRERAEAKGTTPEAQNFMLPTFFQTRESGRPKAWEIADVVRWSRTARGGKQFDMFGADPSDGCMRWGLCDTGAAT
jgi:3'-phosphoadenosine 5'-phosphosulfate sulfotransferase (PAPS reductase)/FAD synthetase